MQSYKTINNYFSLNKNTPIIIYGMAKTGVELYKNLVIAGFNIIGFIDKKCNESTNGENVFFFKNITEAMQIVDDFTIIISIRNSIEQNNIAENLYKNGCDKIIFLPTIINGNNKNIDLMRKVYRNIDKGIFIEYHNEIPYYFSIINSCGLDDFYFNSRDGYCTVLLPISLLYMESIDYYQKLIDVYGIDCIPEYYEKNIVANKPLIELFKFLENGNGDIDFYNMKVNKKENSIHKNSTTINQMWINDRKKCFMLLSDGLQNNESFFWKSAIPVEWNKKGYFNLTDGKHRGVFLYLKGFNLIPVEMKVSDYEIWMNRKMAKKCIDYAKNNNINKFTYPIEHPYFYKYDSCYDKFGKTILSTIQEFFGNSDIEGLSFLDINSKNGYFARNFSRYGCNVTAIEEDKINYDFIILLNSLFSQYKIKMYNNSFVNLNLEKKFDIVIGINVFSNIKYNFKKVINKIDKITNNVLIWETSFEIEKEKSWILNNTGFKFYSTLRKTFSNNQIHELVIFYK